MEKNIGVDFHLQYSNVAAMNREGQVLDEKKLYHTDKKAIDAFFKSFPKGTPVAMEATRNWYWFVDYLQAMGMNVKLVHAKKARIIAESTIKTDKIDARILAHLDRCNFLPQAYIANRDIRGQRELLRYYMSLVKIRSSVKNKIHAILAKNNAIHNYSDLFGKAGMVFLSELQLPRTFRMELDGYLELLAHLKGSINDTKKEIKKVCEQSVYAVRLTSVPGISYFSALLLAAEIADISRFKSQKKLCAYAGLVSTTRQSAGKNHQGHIIKDSNKYIRYVLVEAVSIAIKRDPRLFVFYTNLQRKKGSNKARIAVARKLLISIYYMLKNDVDYRFEKQVYTRVSPSVRLGRV